MKFFFATLFCLTLFCANAFAGGRLSIQGNAFDGKDGIHPMLGLSIDQKLVGNIFVNSWTGYGTRPVLDETKEWAAGKLGVDVRFNLFHFGTGVFANTGGGDIFAEDVGIETGGYVKASMKLW